MSSAPTALIHAIEPNHIIANLASLLEHRTGTLKNKLHLVWKYVQCTRWNGKKIGEFDGNNYECMR